MNKYTFIVFLVLLPLASACSKYKRAQKHLGGTWTIVSYQYTTAVGLNYYPEVSGKMFFESCGSETCAYSLDISYSSPQIIGSRVETGTYTLNSEGNRLELIQILPDNSTVNKGSHLIVVLTNNDLKLELVDSLGRVHRYIFEQ